jgi:hypothetical protein
MTSAELHAEIGKLLDLDEHLESPRATRRLWASCKVRVRGDLLLVGCDSDFTATILRREVRALVAAGSIVLRRETPLTVRISVIEGGP